MAEHTPVWPAAELLAQKLEVVDTLLSLFPRCNLLGSLEEHETIALLSHAAQLAMEAKNEAQAIMRADMARTRPAEAGGVA